MRKSMLVGGLATVLVSMVLVLPPPAATAAPGGGGGGGGGGSGEIYADLFVALRDEDGVPILSETFYEEGPVEVACVQPISYDDDSLGPCRSFQPFPALDAQSGRRPTGLSRPTAG